MVAVEHVESFNGEHIRPSRAVEEPSSSTLWGVRAVVSIIDVTVALSSVCSGVSSDRVSGYSTMNLLRTSAAETPRDAARTTMATRL